MKKVKIKLIIYIVLAILPWICYWLFLPLTTPLKNCGWNGVCSEPVINSTESMLICAGISLVFIIFTINTIIKLKTK